MTMRGNLGQIHRNLESAEIWNCSKTVRAQGVAAKIQISAKSGLKSRNLAQALVFNAFAPPQILEKLPILRMG
jgi:hypothetical protein